MKNKLSSKEMILDIMTMRSHAMTLLSQENDYNSLLLALTEKDYYYDDRLEIPSLKDFAKMTGLSYDKVRKYLKMLYDDIVTDGNRKPVFEFNSVEYIFWLKGYRESASFTISNLPVVPRVGENIEVPFFNALTGSRGYYVDSVNHSLEDGKQVVFINLIHGYHNSYWRFRKDQAEEEGELSLKELHEMDEYSLKKKLKLRYYQF